MLPAELIKNHFKYLLDEYGFSIEREYYSPEIMGNAAVVYISNTTGVIIAVDRSQVLISIGRSALPEDQWFEFSDVIHFYAPTVKEAYIFQIDDTHLVEVELQLERLAQLLRKYCEPLLRGNFSDEDQIKEFERQRAEEMLEDFRKLSEDKRKTK